MTPFERIAYGNEYDTDDRNRILYEYRNQPVFAVMLQYLRDEAYAALAESIKGKLDGKPQVADLALGGFDRVSQIIVKIKAISEIPPKAPE